MNYCPNSNNASKIGKFNTSNFQIKSNASLVENYFAWFSTYYHCVILFRDNCPAVGDIMSDFAPCLKLYSRYVANFEKAIKMVNSYEAKCPDFKKYAKELVVCVILVCSDINSILG